MMMGVDKCEDNGMCLVVVVGACDDGRMYVCWLLNVRVVIVINDAGGCWR